MARTAIRSLRRMRLRGATLMSGALNGSPPDAMSAPTVESPPSISPASGVPGTVFSITPAVYGGFPRPLRTFTLLEGGVDVTSLMVGYSYTSQRENASLIWTEAAHNVAGSSTSAVATAATTAFPSPPPSQPISTSWSIAAGELSAVITVGSLPAGAVSVQYEHPAGTWTAVSGGTATISGLPADEDFSTRLRGVNAGGVPGPASTTKSATPRAVRTPFGIAVASGRARFSGDDAELVVVNGKAFWAYTTGETGGTGGSGGGSGGTGTPGPYTPDVLAAGQTSWTVAAHVHPVADAAMSVTITSSEAVQIGRHASGEIYIYNPASRTQPISISFSVPSSTDGTRWKSGAVIGALQEVAQGFDSFQTTTDTDVPYSHALNIDPGATGRPISINPGEETTIIKALSLAAPDPDGRPKLEYLFPVTVLNTLPPAQSFRAAPIALRKTLGLGRDDLNLAVLPNLPLVSGAPVVEDRRRLNLLHANATNYKQPRGERITAQAAEATYRSNKASDQAEDVMLCAMAIDPGAKADIAMGLVQRGLDVAEQIRKGGRTFVTTQSGLGGVYPGYKLLVAFAAVLLDDAELAAMCDPAAANFVEDWQVHTVTQSFVDLYDYTEDDLGMPEWNINPVAAKASNTRTMAKRYRSVFNGHLLAQTMAARVIPGMRAVWAFPPIFDYADRMNILTCYKDPLSEVAWALTHSNRPSAFTQNFHAAYRDLPTAGARWAWPA